MTDAMKKRSKYWKIIVILVLTTAVLNLAGFLKPFCDFYTAHIYPVICSGLSSVTNAVSVPVGEIMMYIGIVLVVLAVPVLLLLIFLRKKEGYRKFAGGYMKTFLLIIVCLLFVYTTNWTIPLRATLLDDWNEIDEAYSSDYVRELYNYTVRSLNEAIDAVPRDKDGKIIYEDKAAVDRSIAEAINSMSGEFPRLRSYCPPCKEAICSDVLDWMGIGGYTYPFTMEMTTNKYVSQLYYPVLAAHETCHHMGYYKENEAEFLGMVVCMNSDDPLLRYAGADSAYSWMSQALMDAFRTDDMSLKDYFNVLKELELEQLDERYDSDVWGAMEEADEAYAADSHPLESYSEVAVEASNVGWNTQADLLKENIYSGAIELLLRYYKDKKIE